MSSNSSSNNGNGTGNGDETDDDEHEEEWVPDVFLFEYGTVVVWGMTEKEEKKFLISLSVVIDSWHDQAAVTDKTSQEEVRGGEVVDRRRRDGGSQLLLRRLLSVSSFMPGRPCSLSDLAGYTTM